MERAPRAHARARSLKLHVLPDDIYYRESVFDLLYGIAHSPIMLPPPQKEKAPLLGASLPSLQFGMDLGEQLIDILQGIALQHAVLYP